MKFDIKAIAENICGFVKFMDDKRVEYNSGDPLMLRFKGDIGVQLAHKSAPEKNFTEDSSKADFKVSIADLAAIFWMLTLLWPLVSAVWSFADRTVRRLDR